MENTKLQWMQKNISSEKEIHKTPSVIKVMKYHELRGAVHVKMTENEIQQSSNGRIFGKGEKKCWRKVMKHHDDKIAVFK